jgi:quinohemoprotein ethanol dehydrogenase
MRTQILSFLGAASLVVLGGIPATSGVALAALPDPATQWTSHGRDHSEQRYSPLKQINADNAGQLGLAWYADLAERGGSYETTPVIADGRIYVSAPWSKVYAFDAKTGKALWKHDPKVPGEWAVSLCCGIVNRGVAVWKDKVIWGTLDGRLIAVNAKTGKVAWDRQVTDKNLPISMTGAPRIANGRIFIGMAGGEFHQRGYMAAYSVDDGRELWRWWAVPGDPSKGFEQPELEMAAKTWKGEWWKTGGGGSTWDGVLYDAQTDSVLVGTGNGAPWPAEIRSPGGGDNLFTASIVALDAKTGKYKWHYQVVPQDSWDYDNVQQLTAADLVINGEKKHVVMQATKSGVFPVIEIATGKVVSMDLYVPTANWMTGWDANYRPILNPEANYGAHDRGFHVVPSAGGAHSWHPMAFSPDTGLMYIPTNYGSFPLVAEAGAKMGNQLLSINVAKRPKDAAPQLEGAGNYLLAWDPVKRTTAWKQPLGSARAGAMATAGNLVFQGGSAAGTFSAFRADNGERVWNTETQANIVGGAATYAIGGEQYVAVVAAGQGRGGGGYWAPNYARLLVYKLGGKATLPQMVAFTPPALNPPAQFGDAALLARGQEKYTAHCSTCHGNDGRVSSIFPDLRYAGALQSADVFKTIVIDGALQPNGMVSFRKVLTPDDAEAIRAYVVSLAIQAKNAPAPAFGGPPGGAPAAAPAAPAPAQGAGTATPPQPAPQLHR